MQNPAATIYCPNYTCQSPNPETHNFCQKCRTPLPKRYLWAVGAGLQTYKPGEILADRYLLKHDRILLDTKPGIPPEMPEDIPDAMAPYLRLFAERLHVPQVYGCVPNKQSRRTPEIWLLEHAPIYPELANSPVSGASTTAPVPGHLLPTLTDVWPSASPMRQLNWLWQIAQLWQLCLSEGVASALLNPKLLRVEGPIVRLLELPLDQKAPTLSQLGQLWSQWVASASGAIAPFLGKVCQQISQGQVRTADQLVALLDRGLTLCSNLYARTYHLATATDKGPSRPRNEDACYPPANTTTIKPAGAESLAIVCDGIGGHEGGNVASNLAIEAVQTHVRQLLGANTRLDPQTLIEELEDSARIANNVISEQNDSEQRQGRQRMGTTLVMALGYGHEIYLTHVGDSRAYWITRTGCRQVTLDDDVASREVRLGYALYRDALQQAASGSLIQALGMGSSTILHPTVQRFIVDEDSVFLLCSDGLSDNDRVDQYWETEILPILDGQRDVAEAVRRLIDIGNFHNGHDNVTVALVYSQVSANKAAGVNPETLVAQLDSVPPPAVPRDDEEDDSNHLPPPTARSSAATTKLLRRQQSADPPRPLLFGIALTIVLGMVGLLAYASIEPVREQIHARMGLNSTEETATDSPSPSLTASPSPTEPPMFSFTSGSFVQIKSSTTGTAEDNSTLNLLRQPGEAKEANAMGIVPAGSILRIEKPPITSEQGSWVQVKVCSTPTDINSASGAVGSEQGQIEGSPQASNSKPVSGIRSTPPAVSSPTPALLTGQPLRQLVARGKVGWIREADLHNLVLPTSSLTEAQRGACKPDATASPKPTNTPNPTPSASGR